MFLNSLWSRASKKSCKIIKASCLIPLKLAYSGFNIFIVFGWFLVSQSNKFDILSKSILSESEGNYLRCVRVWDVSWRSRKGVRFGVGERCGFGDVFGFLWSTGLFVRSNVIFVGFCSITLPFSIGDGHFFGFYIRVIGNYFFYFILSQLIGYFLFLGSFAFYF